MKLIFAPMRDFLRTGVDLFQTEQARRTSYDFRRTLSRSFCYGLKSLMVVATGRKLPLVSSIW